MKFTGFALLTIGAVVLVAADLQIAAGIAMVILGCALLGGL